MIMDFYGVKIDPPTRSIAKAFGSYGEPVLLKGGQGTTYRSGEIVLKPSEGEEANWFSELFHNIHESNGVRFAKPIRASSGSWVHEGYVGWSFLEGEHIKGRFDKKVSASIAFHNLLKNIPRPEFLIKPRSSWSAASYVVWETNKYDYDKEFMLLINQITEKLEPLNLPFQLTHGDLSGNFLFHPDLPPAIIDFSPVWAPNGFAEGVMLADAITWEDANTYELEIFKSIPNIEQLAWRGVLRRIIEQAEHIKWFDKDKTQAVEEAKEFQKAIDFLNNFDK